ncbi:MAG TPA: SRPBCC family protein [Terriglobales bacterium]|nr:SRPBCC family protein [Terriglobales bacterium]
MEEVIRDGKPEAANDFQEHSMNRMLRGENRLIIPMVAGLAVGAWGISRRNLAGNAMAVAGGYLAYRAASHLHPYRVSVVVSQTINRPPSEVFQFCRRPQNWTTLMQTWQSSHGPGSKGGHDKFSIAAFNRDIQIVEEQENELIAWRSSQGSEIRQRGTLRFHQAPGNRGTEVSISLYYEAPAGWFTRALRSTLGRDPEQHAREGLRALKSLLEAGEIPTIAGQPSGRRGLKGKLLKTIYRESTREQAA